MDSNSRTMSFRDQQKRAGIVEEMRGKEQERGAGGDGETYGIQHDAQAVYITREHIRKTDMGNRISQSASSRR